ncbi:nucleoporin Pom152 [Aulographum hederae CBS 113979]|uniref:Nucleoporin Pom152 n=1 Tax=Aulographum hederae CBS 113979 TaxID=1176131 RepID=A0A6G1GT32_9PEZI|nr:nucleoporin Pom152 [Aulographum hederae CBS 113979]
MNGTPRLRSAYPPTPQTNRRDPSAISPLRKAAPPVRPLENNPEQESPVIPFDVVDPATQRRLAAAAYAALWAWRFMDFWSLLEDDTEAFWQFMKWVLIDLMFMFGLPALRIPWLEWSQPVMWSLFLAHAVLDGMLMFQIFPPVLAWTVGLTKLVYNRELAISERRVKPGEVLHNSSLLLGKQIIHILPEGSATLNPNNEPFCLGGLHKHIDVPLQINQTNPKLIELERIDLDTSEFEMIKITSKQIRKMKSEAKKLSKATDGDSPIILRYQIKRPGMYIMRKVIDETNLEVQTRNTELTVVSCPQARVKPTSKAKCRGELSDVAVEVIGVPPLKMKYRQMVNELEREASFQSIQPDEFVSPLARQQTSDMLVQRDQIDVSWARAQKVIVPLNETLTHSGKWMFSVDEVQDAMGNVVNFRADDRDAPHAVSQELHQAFAVHERPGLSLKIPNIQGSLKVARGDYAQMPIRYKSTGKDTKATSAHTIEYLFTPEEEMLPSGEHSPKAQLKKESLKYTSQKPMISAAGLYTLKFVSNEFCSGEILEPASILLENPPEPDLAIASEKITDRCADNAIGLRVALDMIGSPPFDVDYTIQKRGSKDAESKSKRIDGIRGQLDLTPGEAGHYTYAFIGISDAVYKGHPITSKNLVLEQDVKPSASAHFIDRHGTKEACFGEPISYTIRLQGEAPWSLEYELVHGGRRTKKTIDNIESEEYPISTDHLTNGGEYTLSLSSVTDNVGCKEFLNDEVKFTVRGQRPKASFNSIAGKFDVRSLQGKDVQLPLRLTGRGPWTIKYQNLDHAPKHVTLRSANGHISVNTEGTYKLVEVNDASCPGSIEEASSIFDVVWVPRPSVKVAEGALMELKGSKYEKRAVCEGDEDTFEVSFTGSAPFDAKYEEHIKLEQGTRSMRVKELNVAQTAASIRMDTSLAGTVEYKFTALSDANYDNDPRSPIEPLIVQQRVNSRPTAVFTHPGKNYNYCPADASSLDSIPVKLTGVPPFTLDIEIKHSGNGGTMKPDRISIPNIPSHTHDIRIPAHHLPLGQSNISIRKVRDARGCQSKSSAIPAPKVQVSVHNAPTIAPLESQTDYCVGDRLSFTLAGKAPFSVYYTFEGVEKRAHAPDTTFRRLAELPGAFAITGLADSASQCRNTHVSLRKTIHPLPSARLSKGRTDVKDIHEGGTVEILFEFGGTPPFEFTYTRSENVKKGKKARVLETKVERSEGYEFRALEGREGTYEVVAVRDRWCAVARQGAETAGRVVGSGAAQRLVAN